MIKKSLPALVLSALLAAGPAAAAIDGSEPLLCSTIDLIECTPGGACQRLSHDEMGASPFLAIDFAKKEITRRPRADNPRVSTFDSLTRVEGKIVLQGLEKAVEEDGDKVRDALGWTITIVEDGGRMVLSASGNEVGFVFFGVCTPGQ